MRCAALRGPTNDNTIVCRKTGRRLAQPRRHAVLPACSSISLPSSPLSASLPPGRLAFTEKTKHTRSPAYLMTHTTLVARLA